MDVGHSLTFRKGFPAKSLFNNKKGV
ncbi:hypothetical protein EMIT0215P_20152 [Pseudomonas serboccidentalis]